MAQNPRPQPSFRGPGGADGPARQPSTVAYSPEGTGIRVIQQYVFTIPEEGSRSETFAREGDIWDYDLIGAVGLKKSKTGKVTVMYHVKWKGFPTSVMTWEPENHFPQGDLELIWSTHGRVNTAGEVSRFRRENDEQHHHLPDKFSASPHTTAPNATQLSDAGLSLHQPMEPRIRVVPNTDSRTV